jgi:hypothetical protein
MRSRGRPKTTPEGALPRHSPGLQCTRRANVRGGCQSDCQSTDDHLTDPIRTSRQEAQLRGTQGTRQSEKTIQDGLRSRVRRFESCRGRRPKRRCSTSAPTPTPPRAGWNPAGASDHGGRLYAKANLHRGLLPALQDPAHPHPCRACTSVHLNTAMSNQVAVVSSKESAS